MALTAKPNLAEGKVAGDGNCLFRAVAAQTPEGEPSHAALRAAVVQEVRDNLDYFLEFFGTDLELANWIDEISKDRGWGDNFALMAICNVLHRPAVVWRRALPRQPPTVLMPTVAEDTHVQALYLMMDERYRGCEHFSPLVWRSTTAGRLPPAAVVAAAPPLPPPEQGPDSSQRSSLSFIVKDDQIFLDVKSLDMVLAAAPSAPPPPAARELLPCADLPKKKYRVRGKQHPAHYIRVSPAKTRPASALARPAASLELVPKRHRDVLCCGFDGPDGDIPCCFAEDGAGGARRLVRAGQRCIFCSPEAIEKVQKSAQSRGPLIKILKQWAQQCPHMLDFAFGNSTLVLLDDEMRCSLRRAATDKKQTGSTADLSGRVSIMGFQDWRKDKYKQKVKEDRAYVKRKFFSGRHRRIKHSMELPAQAEKTPSQEARRRPGLGGGSRRRAGGRDRRRQNEPQAKLPLEGHGAHCGLLRRL